MIKIQNNILSRDQIPDFLIGLAPETLLDLSWTDPALGVSDSKWLPEVDNSPVLKEYERYGAETLKLEQGYVSVTRAIVPWSAEEILADKEQKYQATVPQVVTMRQARLALLSAGLLTNVTTAINSLPNEQKAAATIEWEYSQTVERKRGFVLLLGSALGLTERQLDDLFTLATTL